MTEDKKQISIWFMAGIILSVYGLTITVTGIYYLFNPLEVVVGADMHLDLPSVTAGPGTKNAVFRRLRPP